MGLGNFVDLVLKGLLTHKELSILLVLAVLVESHHPQPNTSGAFLILKKFFARGLPPYSGPNVSGLLTGH